MQPEGLREGDLISVSKERACYEKDAEVPEEETVAENTNIKGVPRGIS